MARRSQRHRQLGDPRALRYLLQDVKSWDMPTIKLAAALPTIQNMEAELFTMVSRQQVVQPALISMGQLCCFTSTRSLRHRQLGAGR